MARNPADAGPVPTIPRTPELSTATLPSDAQIQAVPTLQPVLHEAHWRAERGPQPKPVLVAGSATPVGNRASRRGGGDGAVWRPRSRSRRRQPAVERVASARIRRAQGVAGGRPSRAVARDTARGSAWRELDDASSEDVQGWLAALREERRARLVSSMATIESILGDVPEPRVPYLLRMHRPGDMGWVVWRHGVLYAEQYGWGENFEALTAEIVAKFVQRLDPKRERCWIAERAGANVGCVFIVRQSKTVARLRLLLVEPEARGLGIGKRLVEECVRFSRQVGYRKITLWTMNVLTAARAIYEKAGFQLVASEPHHEFGDGLLAETWDLTL